MPSEAMLEFGAQPVTLTHAGDVFFAPDNRRINTGPVEHADPLLL